MPLRVFGEFAAGNMLVPNLPAPLPVEWLKKVGIHEMPGGIKVEEWDYMHTAVYCAEVSSSSCGRVSIHEMSTLWLRHMEHGTDE